MKVTCTFDTDTHKVVPIEPSPKMVDATFNDDLSMMSHNKRNKHIYGAMIAAAPPYPADEPFTNSISGLRVGMTLCELCGSKRCQHATDKNLACTNSNEDGQFGSSYTAAPKLGKP